VEIVNILLQYIYVNLDCLFSDLT